MSARVRPNLNLVTLGVDDLARALAFYRDAFGWKTSSASVEGVVAFFDLGGVVLALWGRAALAADAGFPGNAPAKGAGAPEGRPAFALAHNVPSRSEVDAVLAIAAKAGARITKPARATDWGGYSGYFVDPDGHLWEVAHNPHWPLDESGRVALPP